MSNLNARTSSPQSDNHPELDDPLLKVLIDSSNDGILIIDLDNFSFVRANEKMTVFFQCSKEEILTSPPMRFLPEFQPDGTSSAEISKGNLSRVKNGENLNFKWQQRNINNELFFTEINVFKIPTKTGNYAVIIHKDLTPLIQSKIEFDIQKERYNFLYENAFDGISLYDIEKKAAIDCNNKLLEFLGLSREEFFNRSIFDISLEFQQDNLPAHQALDKIIAELKEKKKHRYQWTHIDNNGEPLITEVSAFIMSPPNEHICMAILKNITSEKKVILELEKSEQHLLNSQNMAKLANFRYNVHQDELVWSAYAYSTLQVDPEKAPKNIRFFVEQVHQDDREGFVQILFFGGEQHCSLETEFRIISPEGKTIHCQFKAEPKIENGEQIFFGTVQDISNQKVIMQSLSETSAKYIDVFENMHDALLVLDGDGYFKDGNKAAEELLGYSKQELKDIRVADIVHPEDKELSLQYLEKLKKDGFYSNYAGRIIRKDGEVRYLQVNSTAIFKNDKLAGSRDIARDITHIKEAEKKREELLKELGAVNQDLKDFAYIVSHDLKAPLRAISSLSTWLLEDYSQQLDEPGVEKLELLNNRVSRMHNFIDGILEYSKIGRAGLSEELVHLNEIVLTSIDIISPPKNFEINILKPLPDFYGQKTRLSQLFQNLIVNAIRYNDKAKGIVNIDWREEEDFLHFSVADNGQGIALKDQERVFQIFKTLQSRDHFESTGIGLTIVKRIVQLYHGKISIESELNKGTCFHFSLKKRKLVTND